MAATVEIIIRDPDSPDSGAPPSPSSPPGDSPSPASPGGAARAVLVVNQTPIPVEVMGGRFTGSGGGSSSSSSRGGSRGSSEPDTDAILRRNRAVGSRSERRAAVNRQRQRAARATEAKRQQAAAEAEAKAQQQLSERNARIAAQAERRQAALRDRQRKARDRQAKKEADERRREAEKQARTREQEARAQARQRQQEAKAREREQQERAALVAGLAASVIRGGGPGAAVGGAAGAALGQRFGGPAGAVVGQAVGEQAGGFVDNPLKGPTEVTQQVAKGDAMGALTSAADKAAIGLALIPGVGLSAALALKTFTSTVGPAKDVLDAFANRGKELAGYSGAIAGAAAQQDVTRLLNDIRESQKLGDQYAKVIESQTRFEETLKAGLLPLKEWLMSWLPKVMDMILDMLINGLEMLNGLVKYFVDDNLLGEMADEMKKMRKTLEGPGVAGDDILKKWMGDGDLGFKFPIGEKPKAGPLDIPAIEKILFGA